MGEVVWNISVTASMKRCASGSTKSCSSPSRSPYSTWHTAASTAPVSPPSTGGDPNAAPPPSTVAKRSLPVAMGTPAAWVLVKCCCQVVCC